MLTLIESIVEMQQTTDRLRQEGKRIGLVPTMGFLHEGHACLIRVAAAETDAVVTSVFVNPAQFGPGEDFERYPRDPERDRKIAASAGTDFLFVPRETSVYPDGYLTYLNVDRMGDLLEGKFRPGHFRGVATIVAKLLNIAKPNVAVFGQKDAQQATIIRKMVRDMNYDTRIIVVPTVREPDGLAMSSRNTYLSDQQRREAPVLYRSLQLAEKRIGEGVKDPESIKREMDTFIKGTSSGVTDYLSIAESETLEEVKHLTTGSELLVSLSVKFGATRLIDNCIVRVT
jgi:pantoate--beta-alanine ligase